MIDIVQSQGDNMKTFSITNDQFNILLSALQHAIDVYQDTRQSKTESSVQDLRKDLIGQAIRQME